MEKLVYNILKFLFRIVLRLFYRRMTVHGHAHKHIKGPFIVISNHPNTLIDALIVGTTLRQRIGFLGNATLFRNKKLGAVLAFLGTIPVYRKEDLLPGETTGKNDEVFQKAYDYLAKGGAFLVFPEGTSLVGKKLNEIRTGTARIALGYEAGRDFKGGIQVLPVSLNYSSSTDFRSRVHVNLNTPIQVSQYAEAYAQDPREAARVLTEDLADSLSDGLVILDDPEQETFFKQVIRLYREQLHGPEELRKPSRKSFEKEKATAEAIRDLKLRDPEKYERLRRSVDSWFGLVDRIGLRQHLLGERAMRWMPGTLTFATLLALIVGLPFALLGFLSGIIPYRISSWLPPKVAKDIEYRAPIMLVAGMFLFPIFYGLFTLAFWLLAPAQISAWWSLAFLALLPFSGWITLAWMDGWDRMEGLFRLMAMGGRQGNAGKRLQEKRAGLLVELKKALRLN